MRRPTAAQFHTPRPIAKSDLAPLFDTRSNPAAVPGGRRMKGTVAMKLAVFVTVLLAALPVVADPPSIDFGPSGLTVRGLKGNGKIAWLGMIRERVGSHTRVRFERGTKHATAGVVAIAEAGADHSASIWAVVDAADGGAAHSAAPRFRHAAQQIDIVAPVGTATIAVESAMVELLYVRPGVGVWRFGTGDGSDLDADLLSNGVVVMPLSALRSIDDDLAPPTVVERRDVLIVMDPTSNRITRLVVSK